MKADKPSVGSVLSRARRAAQGAALALSLLAAAAAPAAAQGPGTSAPVKAPKADRDRDKVFDDLEQRLAPRPGEEEVDVIVSLEDPASSARVSRLERRVGRLAVRDRFRVVDAFAARVSKQQVAALVARPGVVSVEADDRVRALNQSGSQAFGVTQARAQNPKLDGDRDGNRGRYTPKDMVAAVVDTGIHSKHRDLDEGKILAFVDCSGDSGGCVRRSPFDNNGHGTHVAGTLAGEGDALADRRNRGVAPFAGLVGVKVLRADGSGSQADVIAGVDWAVANRGRYGIEAINLSLGGAGCSDGTDAMSRAANRAAKAGMIVVAAAGNSGPARCTVSAPGAASKALTVGSMADLAHGGFFPAWKSARGQYGRQVKPDVMGPGVGVVSARYGTQTGYWTKSGTSTASPFVAGVALLMRDANLSLSAGQIRWRIKATAVDWGPAGADIDFGSGRLDAYGALRSAGASGLDNPPRPPEHRAYEGSFQTSGDTEVDSPEEFREYPIEVKNRCSPVAASLITKRWNGYTGEWEPGDYDFDVRLYDPAGKEVVPGAGATDERQEDLSHRPAGTGTYKIRVENFLGSGEYFADVSAGLSAPPYGAPATCSTPFSQP